MKKILTQLNSLDAQSMENVYSQKVIQSIRESLEAKLNEMNIMCHKADSFNEKCAYMECIRVLEGE